jgi:hypothetical protein
MKVFFDTEFTDLHQNTTLISIGFIDENNMKFYGEFTDYDKSQCNEWINKHVLANLLYPKKNSPEFYDTIRAIARTPKDSLMYVYGEKDIIKKNALSWLSKYDTIEWVSDVSHYDMVLLIDLLYGNARQVPDNVGKCCHDINQDIAAYWQISVNEAFDRSREDMIEENMKYSVKDIPLLDSKYNHLSLHDAAVIELLYNYFSAC